MEVINNWIIELASGFIRIDNELDTYWSNGGTKFKWTTPKNNWLIVYSDIRWIVK